MQGFVDTLYSIKGDSLALKYDHCGVRVKRTNGCIDWIFIKSTHGQLICALRIWPSGKLTLECLKIAKNLSFFSTKLPMADKLHQILTSYKTNSAAAFIIMTTPIITIESPKERIRTIRVTDNTQKVAENFVSIESIVSSILKKL